MGKLRRCFHGRYESANWDGLSETLSSHSLKLVLRPVNGASWGSAVISAYPTHQGCLQDMVKNIKMLAMTLGLKLCPQAFLPVSASCLPGGGGGGDPEASLEFGKGWLGSYC